MIDSSEKNGFEMNWIPKLLESSREAGEILMHYFDGHSPLRAMEKADESPVTQADLQADKFIRKVLLDIAPSIPVISEEHRLPSDSEIAKFTDFWLVDPLDGTRAFMRGSGEFAVNIAFVHQHEPVFGIIYLPFTQQLYWGHVGKNAFRSESITKDGKNPHTEEISISGKKKDLTAILSHMYAQTEREEILVNYPITKWVGASSALKFCRVAEGVADLYARKGRTMEWDTAAGQAIIEAAGGIVTNPYTGERIRYKKPGMDNGPFLCSGMGS